MVVNNKIELADLTAAAHVSCIDYLGDMPWEKFPEIKRYSRIKVDRALDQYLQIKLLEFHQGEIMHSLISKEKIQKKSEEFGFDIIKITEPNS